MPLRRVLTSPAAAVLAAAATLLSAPAVRADEIAVLPLGDPSRALRLGTGEAGQFLWLAAPGSEAGAARSFDEMVADLAAADVVVLGEHHAHEEGHRLQARLVEALAARRPLALGMEFFESEDDAALADHLAGRIDAGELVLRSGWYDDGGFHHDYYFPLVDAARRAGAPVFGMNVPRRLIRSISREGLESLTEPERERIGALGPPEERHRFLVDLMMGGAGSAMGPAFDGMLRGQMAWDAAMARAILRARSGVARDRLVLAIAGMGHSAHGLGIPARLRAEDASLRVVVVNPVIAEAPPEHAMTHPGMEAKASATLSLGYAEWAVVLPDAEGAEALPTWGMKLEAPRDDGRGIAIASVTPGAVAARAGLRAGDVLLRAGGEPLPSTPPAARLRLSGARWGDRVEMDVQRDGAEFRIPVLLVPATDGPGRWLRSRRVSGLLDGFDPASARPILPEPSPDLPQARLVEHGTRAVRLDVLAGPRLMQAWTLDANGRPTLGLLAEPAADGAVRIEIDRAATGEAIAVRRIDAAGRLVTAEPPAPAPASH